MGRGSVYFPPDGSVHRYVYSRVASLVGFFKNLRVTILKDKDKNFPEELLDLTGFFRLLRRSLRAP